MLAHTPWGLRPRCAHTEELRRHTREILRRKDRRELYPDRFPHRRHHGKSSTLADFELPLSENAFLAAKNGETTFETVRTFGVYPVRLITRPIMMKDYGFIGIIQVGSSLEGMDEVYRRMTYLFIFGLVASVAVAGCAGWFLARKALRPVIEITKAARRITVQNLNERISIKGPEDEIGRLAATLNGMIGRLERSFNQIKQFTEDASHELKTPLTIMKGEIEVTLRSVSSRRNSRRPSPRSWKR